MHQRNMHFKSSRKKFLINFSLVNKSEPFSMIFPEADGGTEEDEKKENPFAIELVSVNGTISLTFSV